MDRDTDKAFQQENSMGMEVDTVHNYLHLVDNNMEGRSIEV